MPLCIDQMGSRVAVPENPERVVSLVKSQTGLLYDLVLEVIIAGQTQFCIHPKEHFNSAAKTGGKKS